MDNKELVERYPFLLPRNVFTDKIPDNYNYEWTLLDDMPDGWRKAFGEQLCEELRLALLNADDVDLFEYRVMQIKEKYGSLRWYGNFYNKEINEILENYGELSEHICIRCGAPATKMSTGWISPWCDSCAKMMEKYENFKNISPLTN